MGTVLLYPKVWLLALPMVRIKQQQPTPIGYSLPIAGKCISNGGVLSLSSSYHFKFCENLTLEDNLNNTFRLNMSLLYELNALSMKSYCKVTKSVYFVSKPIALNYVIIPYPFDSCFIAKIEKRYGIYRIYFYTPIRILSGLAHKGKQGRKRQIFPPKKTGVSPEENYSSLRKKLEFPPKETKTPFQPPDLFPFRLNS